MNAEVRRQLVGNAANRKRVLADGGQIVLNLLTATRVGDDEKRLAQLDFDEIESLVQSLREKSTAMRALLDEYSELKAQR